MSEVKRYEPKNVEDDFYNPVEMEEVAYGDYVTHDDYAQLASDLKRVEAERDELRKVVVAARHWRRVPAWVENPQAFSLRSEIDKYEQAQAKGTTHEICD